MSGVHAATAGALVRELVDAVVREVDRWADVAVRQAGGIHPTDGAEAARFAVSDVKADLDDHLGIALSIVLASYGITADGAS